MASTYNGNSIVDYIKSTGGDASFNSRASLAVKQGIVKDVSEYTGTSGQNTSLLSSLRGASATPATVNNQQDASAYINARQQNDVELAKSSNEPETRSVTEQYVSAFKTLTGSSSVLPSYDAPDTPNFEETYTQLRGQYGIQGLETSLNSLQTDAENIRASLRADRYDEEGKPVALGVIGGRISEEERVANERLDVINQGINAVTRQLTAANSVIETTMNLRKMDYEAAKSAYDTQFSQNMQLFGMVKGIVDTENSREDARKDSARANLQIISNGLIESGKSINDVDEATRYQINKLELEAGLPSGFFNTILEDIPDNGEIISTTTRTSGGTKYADILTRNADGSISAKTVALGSDSGGGGSTTYTESELSRAARSEIAAALNPRRGEDGYVAPADWKQARNAWVSKGFSAADFNESFAREYVNPDHFSDYGVQLDLIL